MKNYLVILLFFTLPLTQLRAQQRDLDYFLHAALSNSPLLKDYGNQQLANLIDSLRILAGYKPQVLGVSNNSYAPTYKGWGYDGAITNGTNFAQLITVSKKLVSPENLDNQQQAIRLLNQSLVVNGKIAEQDLKKSITAQYITTYGDGQQIDFHQEMTGLLRKEEKVLRTLTERGIYRQTDYLSFLVTLQQEELLLGQLNLQFQNDLAALNLICAINDSAQVKLAAPEIEISVPPPAEHTVFYQQFATDSLRLKNTAAQLDFTYKPKVSLYADAGYLTSFALQPYKNFGTSVGFSVTVPIYDGKQKKMQLDKIQLAEQTRTYYRDFFVRQFSQQVAQLNRQLRGVQELISQASLQIKYAGTLVEANRKLLETGDVHMPDYLLAIGNYLNAKNIITQNTVTRLQIINQINYWNRQ